MNANDPGSIQLNELELKIVSLCSPRAMGVKEMAGMLGIPYSGGDMKRAITRLLQLKLIEYRFPECHRSYSQRYKTTLKGKEQPHK